MAIIRKGYADTPVGQIHYREAGTGDPIICFHKTPSSSAIYSRVLPLLGERYRAIAMDNPGFGMSDPLPQAPGPTMRPYLDVALAFMDALEIERATVVGHSTGAAIAMGLAGHHPERVANLIVASFTGCENPDDNEALFKVLRSRISPHWGQPVQTDANGDFLEQYPLGPLRNMVSPLGDPEHFITELIAFLQGLPDYQWPFEAVLAQPGPFALFPRISCPTLFVNAQSGIGYPFTKGAHERFPGSHYTEVAGTAEYLMQNPQGLAAAVTEFLDAHGAR